MTNLIPFPRSSSRAPPTLLDSACGLADPPADLAKAKALLEIGPVKAVPGADPILAAIENHRAAITAYRSSVNVYGNIYPHAPNYDDFEEIDDELMSRESKALREVLSCQPTTLAGLAALVHHLGQPEFLIYGRKGTGQVILQEALAEHNVEAKAFLIRLAETVRALAV
jgi:hypothetical protein